MNEFKKNDLTEILRCLKYMTKGDVTPYSCHTIALVKRVRAMIETYDDNKPPLEMAECVCSKCNEEWRLCECRHD